MGIFCCWGQKHSGVGGIQQITLAERGALHAPRGCLRSSCSDRWLPQIADFYESEVDAAVKALTSIIEPLMIVVVGGIIIAMYLPMFKIFELVQ
jgi:hypothetical protein